MLSQPSTDGSSRQSDLQVPPTSWLRCLFSVQALSVMIGFAPPQSQVCKRDMHADQGVTDHPEEAASAQVCKARALAQFGPPYADAAGLLISEVLQKEPEHEGALLEYVARVLARGADADALRILLRLLVRSHGNARVRYAAALCDPCCSEDLSV